MTLLIQAAKKAAPWAFKAYIVYSIILDTMIVGGAIYYFLFFHP